MALTTQVSLLRVREGANGVAGDPGAVIESFSYWQRITWLGWSLGVCAAWYRVRSVKRITSFQNEGSHLMRRAPGRPRAVAVDRAILEATLALLAEHGYADLVLTAVATRAGVSTATLYRRWTSKAPLVLDALRTLILTVPIPDTGDTRADLVAFLTERMQTASTPLLKQIIPALVAEGQHTPEFAELFWSLQRPVRALAFTLFERGIARGDLPPWLDRELALDLLLGPMTFRQFISGGSLDPALAPMIVDGVLHGIACRTALES